MNWRIKDEFVNKRLIDEKKKNWRIKVEMANKR